MGNYMFWCKYISGLRFLYQVPNGLQRFYQWCKLKFSTYFELLSPFDIHICCLILALKLYSLCLKQDHFFYFLNPLCKIGYCSLLHMCLAQLSWLPQLNVKLWWINERRPVSFQRIFWRNLTICVFWLQRLLNGLSISKYLKALQFCYCPLCGLELRQLLLISLLQVRRKLMFPNFCMVYHILQCTKIRH